MVKQYVFNYSLNGYPNKTLITGFIDNTQTSCTKVINDISENKYLFKTKHHFVIIFSNSMQRYFLLSRHYKYFYICKKYLSEIHTNNPKNMVCKNSPDENLEYIVDYMSNKYSSLKEILRTNLYTTLIDDTFGLSNSIYSIFYINSNIRYKSQSRENTYMFNPIMENVLDDIIESNNSQLSIPFVSFNTNMTYNKILFCSTNNSYLNSIRNNLNDITIKEKIFDQNYISSLNESHRTTFLYKIFGVQNVNVIRTSTTDQIDILLSGIQRNEYYIITYHDKNANHNLSTVTYVINKKEYNKYLLNNRFEIIKHRIYKRSTMS